MDSLSSPLVSVPLGWAVAGLGSVEPWCLGPDSALDLWGQILWEVGVGSGSIAEGLCVSVLSQGGHCTSLLLRDSFSVGTIGQVQSSLGEQFFPVTRTRRPQLSIPGGPPILHPCL